MTAEIESQAKRREIEMAEQTQTDNQTQTKDTTELLRLEVGLLPTRQPH
jgi:hypothetical protein